MVEIKVIGDNEKMLGTRRSHRKAITVPVARQRAKRTPWSESAEKVQIEARRAARGGLPFMAWDGEGITAEDGTMSYILLGHTAGIDDGDKPTRFESQTGERLGTLELLDFIWNDGKQYAKYFHVSFGFNFDVDQILRDIPDRLIQTLKDENEIKWRGYNIFYIPRKMFSISYRGRNRITIYDTLSFFGVSLIKAARQYLGNDPLIDEVAKGKDQRNVFTFEELDTLILPYWVKEGELMLRLMNALRHSMIGAGIHLQKWHGPGAIAETLIERERLAAHIEESRTEMPSQVVDATAYAYFGGRFECMKFGEIPGPIYSYDIRSAYPYSLTKLGSLSGGQWVQGGEVQENGIYHVRLKGHPQQGDIGMGPLPYRSDKGLVSYPTTCEGWYFGPEVRAAIITGWNVEILSGWEYQNPEPSPFDFLREMYQQRADYKRAGNQAQYACKLGFNSVYGKLAQLVGWNQKTHLPPKFHQQWYAGMATSRTRAMLWHAIMQNPQAIIAVETDGIYSTEPLDLRLGEQLGEWELEEYDGMLYVQNGIYFGRQNGEWIKARTRGISKGNVTVSDAFNALDSLSPLYSKQTRYGSLTGSLGSPKRFTWYEQESEINWGYSEKRAHFLPACACCQAGENWTGPRTHTTVIKWPIVGMSNPRIIPWIDGMEYVPQEEDDEWEDTQDDE